jgi:hypothetical protein
MMLKKSAGQTDLKNRAIQKAGICLACLLIISNFIDVEVSSANPRKVGSAEWNLGWNHQSATTTRSSDRKTLLTNLPDANNINGSLSAQFRLYMGGGSNTVVTIRPLQYQEWVSCAAVTVNSPFIDSFCEVKHHTPGNNGLRYLNQRTKVKLEIKSPGHTARYLYWEFVPLAAPPIIGTPLPSPGQQLQTYEIGPANIGAFFNTAKERGYLFLASEINPGISDTPVTNPPIGNIHITPSFILHSGGVLIKFGNIYPAPAPWSILAGKRVLVRMFDGKQTLSPGWTFESLNYRGQPGEVCRRMNFKKDEGTDKIFHEFEVHVQLVSFPPVRSCSKMWLQSIRLKGPAGRRPAEALRQD